MAKLFSMGCEQSLSGMALASPCPSPPHQSQKRVSSLDYVFLAIGVGERDQECAVPLTHSWLRWLPREEGAHPLPGHRVVRAAAVAGCSGQRLLACRSHQSRSGQLRAATEDKSRTRHKTES